MDENNVAKAVVLPLVSPESSSYLNLTEQALAGAKAYPDRLIPFCCIDPRTSYRDGRKGLVAMLKEYVDQGAKGFGEHKVGLPIDDPKMMAAYEACDDLKLPVLFHCDDIRGTDQAGLPGLGRVLSAFPNVNFIGHGPGFWASISGDVPTSGLGGYPKTKVFPGGALDRLFDAHKNLWGDLSAGSGANAIGRDQEFGRGFLRPPGRPPALRDRLPEARPGRPPVQAAGRHRPPRRRPRQDRTRQRRQAAEAVGLTHRARPRSRSRFDESRRSPLPSRVPRLVLGRPRRRRASAVRKPRRRPAPRPGSRSTAARRRSASGSRSSSAGASPRRNGSTR